MRKKRKTLIVLIMIFSLISWGCEKDENNDTPADTCQESWGSRDNYVGTAVMREVTTNQVCEYLAELDVSTTTAVGMIIGIDPLINPSEFCFPYMNRLVWSGIVGCDRNHVSFELTENDYRSVINFYKDENNNVHADGSYYERDSNDIMVLIATLSFQYLN